MKFQLDLKYAVRLLMKNPGFLVLTVTVMSVGLGLSFFMMAFVDHIAMRPLPFKNGESMVVLSRMINGLAHGGTMSLHEYRELKDGTTSFSMMGAYHGDSLILSADDRSVRYVGSRVEPVFFEFVGVDPILGRVLTAEDDVPGAQAVTVIGYDLWQNYFNASAEIIGQQIKINGEVVEVVGVMPEHFDFPLTARLWMAMRADADAALWGEGLEVEVFAMLKPGIAMATANDDVKAIMQRVELEHPQINSGVSGKVMTYKRYYLGVGADRIFLVMRVAVLFVLVLACINVANLLLARGNERGKETAIRIALGAPKTRLIMQMMWESAIISFLGGAIAVLLAGWGLEHNNRVFSTLLQDKLPPWWHATLDAPMLGIALLITLVTAFVTGIAPAWKMSSGDFNAVLRDGTRGAQGRRAGRMGRIMVVSEVGLSTALLIVAAVLSVLIRQEMNADYGARIDGILIADVLLPERSYPDDPHRLRYYEQLTSELSRIPGVNAAGVASSLPATFSGSYSFEPEGYEIIEDQYPRAGFSGVGVDFFKAFDIRVLEGRALDSRDTADGLKTAVISDSLANRYWPNGDAVGGRLRWFDEGEDFGWVTVVGVVPHILHGQPIEAVKHQPTIYGPLTQYPGAYRSLFVTTDADPNTLRQPVIDAAARVDAEVPIDRIRSLREHVTMNTMGIDYIKNLFLIFSLCALFMASSGIYGVTANSIHQRTQEIGMRRALGAADERVMIWLMRQSWYQLGLGVILGIPLAFVMSRGFVEMIGPATPDHNWSFLLIPLLIACVVSLATFIPARRAIQLEPSAALHHE